MKQRSKFALALLLLTAMLGTAMVAGFEFYKDQQQQEQAENVNQTSRLAAQQIDERVQQQQDYIGYVAGRSEATNFRASTSYLNGIVQNSRFFAAQLIAANGTIIDWQGGISEEIRRQEIGKNASERPYVQDALRGNTFIGEVQHVNNTDRYLVIISAPIVDSQSEDKIQGVVAASIYINENTLLAPVETVARTDQTVTVSSGSAVLYSTQQPFEQRTVDNTSVTTTNWTVTVARDASGLTQELELLAIGQGVGLLVLLLVIAGFGYWQYKSNFEQAERLVSAFADVQEGNFEKNVNLSSGDEWMKINTGFNQMVTELNERERAIEEREQRLEVLNRVLRHNLRNDMTVIINRTQLLPSVDDDQRQQSLADKVIETAEGLLAHGEKARKIETAIDSAKKDRVSIDVVPIISDLAQTYASEFPEVEITTSLPETAEITAISSFEYAVENVIENACVHNDSDDPVVEISLDEKQDGLVCLSVTDNGPGIPESERELYRKGKEESALEHGSGVGLWLGYWIMEKSGGQLRFDTGIDTGTTVQLLFESPS